MGSVVSDAAFLSTSKNYLDASNYAKPGEFDPKAKKLGLDDPPGKVIVRMVATSKTNTKGLFVENISFFSSEQEVMLAPGSRMRINRIGKDNENEHTVYVDAELLD